jgi:hypothetical protein
MIFNWILHLNRPDDFASTIFDYDVSIIHITEPYHHTIGYYHNLPKILEDSVLALNNGRCVICLPQSRNFISKRVNQEGMSAYQWLESIGGQLQDNEGEDIRASCAGRAKVIQDYLKYAPRYYQIVTKPTPSPQSVLAVVDDTEIVVGLEHQVGNGTVVILPPPKFQKDSEYMVMSKLIEIARHYFGRSQRHIAVGDVPDWLTDYLVPRAKTLDDEIKKLTDEKEKYDRLSYVLYGTGTPLEASGAVLLNNLGLDVERQPTGANIDLKARHPKMNIGFAIEVTGTKDLIRKSSKKVAQAFQYLQERSGTPEEKDMLVIVANSQYHLNPKQRNPEGYTPDIVNLLSKNGVLMITAMQLYEQWRAVHEGRKISNDIVSELFNSYGLFTKSS